MSALPPFDMRNFCKAVVAACAIYLLYIGVTCPCGNNNDKGLYRCHLTEMYAAVTIIVGIFLYQNGARVMSY
jgi:hypothetical protein